MHVQVLNRWKEGPYTIFYTIFYLGGNVCEKFNIDQIVVGIMQNFNFDVHVLLLFIIYTSKLYLTKCAPPPLAYFQNFPVLSK